MSKSIAIVLVALTVVVFETSTTASAATTCSGELKSCASRARHPRTCVLAKEECMKTGRWVGPETGKDFGPRRKE
ncbi:hypothetical protein [Bradyrhizobium sp.]